MKNDKDLRGLRKLFHEVETSVRNIRTLNVDTSTYGSLLVPLLNEKLSPDLRLRLSRNFENEVWILDNMLEMLKLEVEAKERSLTIAIGSNFKNDRTPFHQPDFTTSALSNVAVRKQCVYCGLSNHLPHKCLKVTNKQERKTVLKTKNLCYICLEPGHIAKFCSLGYVCKKCDKKHHVSICSYDPSPLNNQQTHQNDSTLNNFSSNQNNVLLQTAYVEAPDLELKNRHFVNALFDSGSQRTYISTDLRNKLGLKTCEKREFSLKRSAIKTQMHCP